MSKNYSLKDPPEKRFWARVTIPDNPELCWEWVGGKTGSGYGAMMINYEFISVHRYSYELHFGGIPEGRFVCHTCDNPSCVNPKHLFLGTPKDNMEDMTNKGRQVTGRWNSYSGEDHPMSKLTWDEVDEMRELYSSGSYTQVALADKFGVTHTSVCDIVHWQIWRKDDSPPPIYPGKYKLSEEQVKEIRSLYKTGKYFQREIGTMFGVNASYVSMLVNNRRRPN